MNYQIIDSANPLWFQTLQQLPHDFYHLPGYFNIEAKKCGGVPEAFLLTNRERYFFVPYLLRRLDDFSKQRKFDSNVLDIVSPYGYPGILMNQAAKTPDFLSFAISRFTEMLRNRSIISAFYACTQFIIRV